MSEPEPAWVALRTDESRRVWREVLVPVAARLRDESATLAKVIVQGMRTGESGHALDIEQVPEAAASTEESLRRFAQVLELGGDPAVGELPLSNAAIVRSAVWQHVALSFHTRHYRYAHQQTWRWLFARVVAATTSADDQARAVDLLTTFLMTFVDRAMIAMDEVYEAERGAWLQGAAASRSAAIEDIIAGRGQDVDVLSTRARYDLGRHHVGIVAALTSTTDRSDPLTNLGEAVAEIARALGTESSLTHPLGSLAVAGWASSRGAVDSRALDRLRDSPTFTPSVAGVSYALGEPHRGLGGFRLTHIEAVHTRRVVTLRRAPHPLVTRYRDVAGEALCTADPTHALRFATTVLGRLAETDEWIGRVAETLAVYLSENRSRSRAAARLIVHPNTVSYRVRQAEELLGHSLDGDTLNLQMALSLRTALPGLRDAEPTGR